MSILAKVAEELNIVLGLQPAIDTTHDNTNLRYLVVKASCLVEAKDSFTKDVAAYLMELPSAPENITVVDSVGAEKKVEVVEEVVEEAATESAPETTTPASKKDSKINQAKNKKRKPHIIRIGELLEEGIYTSEEIVNIIVTEFEGKRKDTISTYVRSAKNPKYNAFSKPVIEVDGIFKFEE